METNRRTFFAFLISILGLFAGISAAQDEVSPPPPLEVMISIADQKLVLLKDGGLLGKFRVSTSRFGAGDSYGSYKTPLGRLRVCDKIGDELAAGAVIKHRSATGEVIPVNAPGRDPIVTRVIWLDGLEDQNHNAKARGIYIHGTPEESNLGKPVSWGCIRMRSEDVIKVYEEIPPGTPVEIIAERLPRLHKYKAPPPPPPPPPPEVIIASATPPPAPPAPPAVAKQKSATTATVLVVKQNVVTNPLPSPTPARIVMAKKVPDRNSPISRIADEIAALNAEVEKPPKVVTNPEAWRAMKGSILLAGLPESSPAVISPKKSPAVAPHAPLPSPEFIGPPQAGTLSSDGTTALSPGGIKLGSAVGAFPVDIFSQSILPSLTSELFDQLAARNAGSESTATTAKVPQ